HDLAPFSLGFTKMKQMEMEKYKNDDKRRNEEEPYTLRLSGTHGVLAFSINPTLAQHEHLLFHFSASLSAPTLSQHENFRFHLSRSLSAKTLAEHEDLFENELVQM
ncbi:hypothetical protein VIGAN_08271800, partial [Vigna angularis var. angularis]